MSSYNIKVKPELSPLHQKLIRRYGELNILPECANENVVSV